MMFLPLRKRAQDLGYLHDSPRLGIGKAVPSIEERVRFQLVRSVFCLPFPKISDISSRLDTLASLLDIAEIQIINFSVKRYAMFIGVEKSLTEGMRLI